MSEVCVFQQVTKWYPPEHLVFQRMDLTIKSGEKILITGCAGSGRTTLVQLAAGGLKPDEGKVQLNGRASMIPECTGWLDNLTLIQHLALSLLGSGMGKRESLCRAAEMLKVLGLEGRGEAAPKQMSIYEKAMTALGQVLMQACDMIVVDTLIERLSRKEKDQWMNVLFQQLDGRALLMVSDHRENDSYFDRILSIEGNSVSN